MWRVIWAQALKKIILSVLASERLPAHSAQLNGSSLLSADIPCGMDLLAEVCGGASRHCGCSSGIFGLTFACHESNVSLDVTLFGCSFGTF